ncbi:hypothetical protein ANCCAN_09996 [Ancylostoma caninum]|uniref:Uncharacterized protein n=1 Tax=Ancylostoma caninum TaxID=29170 RepID=A0A368GI37_ANCCA|nr:hypothetical protein ANCCAN_09996 [Ancylostoma caninum]
MCFDLFVYCTELCSASCSLSAQRTRECMRRPVRAELRRATEQAANPSFLKERELPCIEVCAPPACVCNDGYIRLKRGGPCVPKNSCPKKLLPTGSTGDNSNPYKKRRFHSQ